MWLPSQAQRVLPCLWHPPRPVQVGPRRAGGSRRSRLQPRGLDGSAERSPNPPVLAPNRGEKPAECDEPHTTRARCVRGHVLLALDVARGPESPASCGGPSQPARRGLRGRPRIRYQSGLVDCTPRYLWCFLLSACRSAVVVCLPAETPRIRSSPGYARAQADRLDGTLLRRLLVLARQGSKKARGLHPNIVVPSPLPDWPRHSIHRSLQRRSRSSRGHTREQRTARN